MAPTLLAVALDDVPPAPPEPPRETAAAPVTAPPIAPDQPPLPPPPPIDCETIPDEKSPRVRILFTKGRP